MALNTGRKLPLILLFLALGAGCASTQDQANPDPFEGANRAVFALNDALDKHLLAPVARGYEYVTPGFIQRGARNFFGNLYDINAAVNAILQGRIKEGAINSGRFIVNSTIGMFGLVDIATEVGLPHYQTDFGHTLALWGFDSGPYLMMPFFGPRTVRSGVGSLFDTVASPQWQFQRGASSALFALEVVDSRAAIAPAEDLITGDRYIFVRDAYLQQREYFVTDGAVEDTFSDFEDDFEWEE